MPLDLLTRLDPLRRVRCPYCFEKFPAFAMHFRCDDPACRIDYARMVDDPILTRALNGPNSAASGAAIRSAWWTDPTVDPSRGPRRYLDWMILPESVTCPNCHKPTDCHLCPKCHAVLPDSVVTLDAGHIAVFGPQSVGKTTFVTVLLHELDHLVGPREGFILEPLTDEVRDRYDREYHEPTFGAGGFGIGQDLEGDAFRRSHSPTPSLEMDRRSLRPLVYRLTRKGTKRSRRTSTLLSFFDAAGEDWESNIELLRGEARYLSHARGLLFLVDPLRIREVARDRRLVLTEKESHVEAADYLGDARKLATFFPRVPVKTPLAIVLNKLDRWGGLLEEGTLLQERTMSVVAEPADRRDDATIHEEVRAALGRWGMGGFLEHIETNFPVHRFFAVSALGDAAPDRDDAPQPLPTPLLVERPVLWLLEKQGLLRDRDKLG